MATAELKKFLDKSGVSTLWGEIAKEVAKVQAAADEVAVVAGENAEAIKGQGERLTAAENKIAALEAGTYDDSEIRGLITANANAITILNGGAEVQGSVANTAATAAALEVASVIADADEDFDTLKEIADWIINDTVGATEMSNNIAALQNKMAGVEETVVKSITDAIENALKTDGVEKYALASELATLAGRVETLENAGYQNASQVSIAIDAAIAALKLADTYEAKGEAAKAETAAKAYAETQVAQGLDEAKAYSDANLVTAKAYSDANLEAAKTYTNTEIAQIQSLSEAEILSAINEAKAE